MRNCAGRIGRSPPSRADSGSIIVLPATMGDRWGDGLATRLDVKNPWGYFTLRAFRASSQACMRFAFWLFERLQHDTVESGRLNLGVGGKEILVAREETCC